jgi:hypothetical protein
MHKDFVQRNGSNMNVGAKTMFFPRTRRTSLENPKTSKGILCQARKIAFLASKACLFLSQQVTISYTNMFESKKLIKNIKQLK